MKATVFSLASLVAVVAAAGAPDTGSLPPCVNDCLQPFFSNSEVAGCKQLDYACVCKNTDFLGKIACCVNDKCDGSSKNAILTFAKPLCKGVGVDVPDNITQACQASKADTTSSSSSSSSSPSSTSAAPAATNDASMNGASGVLGAVAAVLMAL